MGFAKVMKLVFGVFVWGRGGFSLPKSEHIKIKEAAERRLLNSVTSSKDSMFSVLGNYLLVLAVAMLE